MHRQVHLANLEVYLFALLAKDADLFCSAFLVFFHKACGLHNHAARSAGRIINAAVKWFYDIHNQLDNRDGRKELAATPAFLHGKLAEEILIDFTKDIPLHVHGNAVKDAQQLKQQAVIKGVILPRQYAAEFLVLGLCFPWPD